MSDPAVVNIASTPSPRPIPPSIQQTPTSQNTSGFVNSSELRHNVDPVLRQELELLYVGVPNFHEVFFGDVPDLDTVSEAVFQKCCQGDTPLFQQGWHGWPATATERDVLAWFGDSIPKLEAFASDCTPAPTTRRVLLAQPRTPLAGSTSKRSMDIGFVSGDVAYRADSEDSRYRWSHILVVGELKSNPAADQESIAWIDLARYAREVFIAQDTRRFVLGFTLCGSLMRVWEFDRLGGIASDQFDINKEHGGLQFVTIMLGFLRMNEEMLGFDPTILKSDGEQYIDIERNGNAERLVIDAVMNRARCISGRATVCWKAHRQDDPHTPLVIKDSWQHVDREEEGMLIQEATEKGVVNVARYYHHETVRIGGADDNVRNNVRGNLDVTKAANYRSKRPMMSSQSSASSVPQKGRSSNTRETRSSSRTDAALPLSKRVCSVSPVKASVVALANRVHRRVIVRDYGKPIYNASSRVALLAALEGCIEGHESLHRAGLLHRDISINNIMINEDGGSPSWSSFLIDLDLAIQEQRQGLSGAQSKTGTRAFMAIGLLRNEQHSFMHDLESFFWVLFWICIHYSRAGEGGRVVPRYDQWNYMPTDWLADVKIGVVHDGDDFVNQAAENFTAYYQPLIPWVNRLRGGVFPNGGRWKSLEPKLYSSMKEILRDARADPEVLADG